MQETVPLLRNDSMHSSTSSSRCSKQSLPAIRCWACWESQNSTSNPLIRVCHGCKDPELQFIHQNCVNAYIQSLPWPRRPRSPRVSENQSLEEFLESEQVFFDCTRCRDPYVVEERDISPFYVIWDDVWVRCLCIAIIVATVLILVFGTLLFEISRENDKVLFCVWGVIPVTLSGVCFLLTTLGVGSGFGLLRSIWMSHSGKKRLFVSGEPL